MNRRLAGGWRQRSVMIVSCLGLSFLAGVLLAGCTVIPTGTELTSWSRPLSVTDPDNVVVSIEGPAQGGQPADIIDGFLVSLSNYEPSYTTARQFLTADLAVSWQPEAMVRVYSGLGDLNTTLLDHQTAQVRLQSLSLIGQVDSAGIYTAVPEQVAEAIEFKLVQADGEWRISELPPGLGSLMTQTRFHDVYQTVNTYFFADQDDVLVPDIRYLPDGDWLRQPLEALLAGPSPWLAPITDSAWLADISLAATPQMDAGVVDIPLALTEPLDAARATELALLCAANLRHLPGIIAVRLMVEGEPVGLDHPPIVIAGQSVPGSLAVTSVDDVNPDVVGRAIHLQTVARQGKITRLDTGLLFSNRQWGNRTITGLAVDASAWKRVAVVTSHGVHFGTLETQTGMHRLALRGAVRPQFDRQGRLWVMAATARGTDVRLAQAGQVETLAAPALDGLTIRNFRLAPDGRRMVVVAETIGEGQRQTRLGLVQVVWRDGQASLEHWRDISLEFAGLALPTVTDVAWWGQSTISVIATTDPSNMNSVYNVDINGLTAPYVVGRPGSAPLVSLSVAANGDLFVLDQAGEVFSWRNTGTWIRLTTEATALS
ncbi:MAG: LpqB family beta-propeller domain-containing protein [Propionibacteriaceae bacterium]|jgi:hypothetical protein|nr:LpqB family beta-propeller domain-containing protein [Propionibacteriaceae bacterium]